MGRPLGEVFSLNSGLHPGEGFSVQYREVGEGRGGESSSVQVFPGARQRAAGGAGGTTDHLHPPGDKNKRCQNRFDTFGTRGV